MPPFNRDHNDILRNLPRHEQELIFQTYIFVSAYLEGRPILEEDEEAIYTVADEVAAYVWQVFREGGQLSNPYIKKLAKDHLSSYWGRKRLELSLNTSRTPKDKEEGLYWLIEQRAAKNTPVRYTQAERRTMIYIVCRRLKDAEREVLELIAEGKDYEQVAHHLGTTKHAIEQRVSRIKAQFKAKFDFLF